MCVPHFSWPPFSSHLWTLGILLLAVMVASMTKVKRKVRTWKPIKKVWTTQVKSQGWREDSLTLTRLQALFITYEAVARLQASVQPSVSVLGGVGPRTSTRLNTNHWCLVKLNNFWPSGCFQGAGLCHVNPPPPIPSPRTIVAITMFSFHPWVDLCQSGGYAAGLVSRQGYLKMTFSRSKGYSIMPVVGTRTLSTSCWVGT